MENLIQLSQKWDLPVCDTVTPISSSVPLSFLKEHGLVPIQETEASLSIALSDPEKLDIVDQLVQLVKKPVVAFLAKPELVHAALHHLERNQADSSEKVMADLKQEDFVISQTAPETVQDLLDLAAQGPVVKLVNRLFMEALERRATDIHIQPDEKKLQVRLRVDGILSDWSSPPRGAQEAIVSRLKVMSGLNIAEKRLPQDGRTSIKIGDKEVDIRVSVVPTAFGERVVLRLLDKKNFQLSELGFSPEIEQQFRALIQAPHGIVLVTGPTGGGKTTTLYSALTYLGAKARNIMTVEDPIEYRLSGISQMQVKPEIGLTFAQGLRSLLRQDPDVLMVGEIRDRETAEVAVQAALTGHLVLATLHTNDAPSALIRLQEIGVEPYLISTTVRGILAQRLIRLICTSCAQKGCPKCLGTGYYGQTGIYELLFLNETLKKCVKQKSDETFIRKAAIKNGMIRLLEDGLKKVEQGLTTREEVLRVTS